MADIVCSLAGIPFVFAARDERLAALFERGLGPLRTKSAAPGSFRCDGRFGVPEPVPAGARIYFDGMLPEVDAACIFGEHNDSRFLIFPDRLSVFGSIARRKASVIVAPGENRALAAIPLMHVLDWALEAEGQSLVHGAALADPAGRHGILFFAPSGAGKTTLSLALLKSGFQLYSDDLAVLSTDGRGCRIGGLARSLKVHQETVRLMPWLGEHMTGAFDENGEQPLSIEVAASIGPLRDGAPLPLVAMFRMAGRNQGGHELSKVSAGEALMSLSSENLRGGMTGVPDFQRVRFRMLTEIVSRVPTYDLVVGKDLAGLGAVIAEQLGWNASATRVTATA